MINPRAHQNESLVAMSTNDKGIIHLPTGTGKSLIQALAIVQDIKERKTPGIYVVLAPRIVLANQLMSDVYKILDDRIVDAQYLIVHSGRPEDLEDIECLHNTENRKVNSTTKTSEIKEDVERAKRNNLPLIICGTYHSADQIKSANIEIDMLLCDEAHNIVTLQFEWVANEKWSKKVFYFTATMRVTSSTDGVGMNNPERFGKVIYSKTPAEMIAAGEIVRPRIHMIDATVAITNEMEGSVDVATVMDAFKEHKAVLNIAPKMLIVTNGSQHLNEILTDANFKAECETRPGLVVFDISSEYGPRIDGKTVDRNEFLKQLKVAGSDINKEMMVFHIDILTEGIDVPGISGVLTFDSMAMVKFIQTVGRASRLNGGDRVKLYNGSIKADELKKFIKPYAYIMVPVYGVTGSDRFEKIHEMVESLRDFNFNPTEDIILRKTAGKFVPEAIGTVTKADENKKALVEYCGGLVHQIEDQKQADELRNEIGKIKTLEDLMNVWE